TEVGDLAGRVQLHGSVGSDSVSGIWSDTDDDFRFTLTAAARLNWRINKTDLEPATISGILLDSNGTYLADRTTLPQGTYVVRAFNNSSTVIADYDVSIVADYAGDGSLSPRDLGAPANVVRVNDFIESVSGDDRRDYYRFQITGKNVPLLAELQAVGADANLALYKDLNDAFGTLEFIAESNKRFAPDSISTMLQPGLYQVVVTSAAGAGNYSLTLYPGDPDDTIRETKFRSVNRRAIGQSINGTVDDAKDVDIFGFAALAGQTVFFDLDSRAGSSVDTNLRLFDAMGQQLSANDDAAFPGEKPGKFSFLSYRFTADGRYYIGVSASPNKRYNANSGGGDVAGATRGAYRLNINQIIVGTSSITGAVFNDRNGNGRRDAGEAGLAGRTVFVDRDLDGLWDENEFGALTDENGNYRINSNPAGDHDLRLVASTGWQQTAPSTGKALKVSTTDGNTTTGQLFGMRRI
ncbi:MAG: SdrD B-like domain-containing protein, partial [Tepidisphaeraceae bacterium]